MGFLLKFISVVFKGGTGIYPGTGFSDQIQQFSNIAGKMGLLGTEDDDLRLSIQSPCIDRGDNTAIPSDEADLYHDNDTTEQIQLDALASKRFVEIPVFRIA